MVEVRRPLPRVAVRGGAEVEGVVTEIAAPGALGGFRERAQLPERVAADFGQRVTALGEELEGVGPVPRGFSAAFARAAARSCSRGARRRTKKSRLTS